MFAGIRNVFMGKTEANSAEPAEPRFDGLERYYQREVDAGILELDRLVKWLAPRRLLDTGYAPAKKYVPHHESADPMVAYKDWCDAADVAMTIPHLPLAAYVKAVSDLASAQYHSIMADKQSISMRLWNKKLELQKATGQCPHGAMRVDLESDTYTCTECGVNVPEDQR
jgi:hypothetical protein